jgi:hypothetical protein
MNSTSPPVSLTPTAGRRRVAWFSIGTAGVAFAINVAVAMAGDRVRWTGWVLPPLIAANAAVIFLGALNRRPTAVRPFMFVSCALAMAIVASETITLFRR